MLLTKMHFSHQIGHTCDSQRRKTRHYRLILYYRLFYRLWWPVMVLSTSLESSKTWTPLQSWKTKHLIHWGTTHLFTFSITGVECYSAHQRRSPPLYATSKLFPTQYGYASWSICTETGLSCLWRHQHQIRFVFVRQKGQSENSSSSTLICICI